MSEPFPRLAPARRWRSIEGSIWMILAVLLCCLCCMVEATVVSSVSSLRTAVESTGGPSTVVIAPGQYLFDRAIVVNRKVAVVARAPSTVRLSGNFSTRLFELFLAADLTLVNVTLEDGRGEAAPSLATQSPYAAPNGGGCIAVYTRSSSAFGPTSALTLQSVELTRCVTLTGNGGAIMLYMPSGSAFTCSDCVFRENVANSTVGAFGYGGAVYWSVYSVPFNSGLKLRFDNSLFDSNSANIGGAVHVDSLAVEAMFSMCNFTRNTAINVGGALSMAEDMSASQVIFQSNSAATGRGHAVAMTNTECIFTRDANTSFVQNGGIDGPSVRAVIDTTQPATQLRIVAFTSAPTFSPFPPVSFPPTSPPVPTTPTVPQPTPTYQPAPSPSSGQDFTTIATGLALGLFFSSMLAILVVVRQRRERGRRANAQRAAEQEHNAFAHRRTNKPKVVTFAELMPEDLAEDPCIICHGDAVVDKSTVSKCAGTISAGKYKLTTQALSTSFARLECGHVFHAACLIMWTEVSGNTTCPECRIVIASEDKRRNSSISSNGSSKSGSRLRPSWSAPSLNFLTSSTPARSPRRQNEPNEGDDDAGDGGGDLPFGNIARRSHNADDLHVENAVLVRELHSARQRSDERRAQASTTSPSTTTTLANTVL